jgi:hypothetical protein
LADCWLAAGLKAPASSISLNTSSMVRGSISSASHSAGKSSRCSTDQSPLEGASAPKGELNSFLGDLNGLSSVQGESLLVLPEPAGSCGEGKQGL